MAEETSVFGRMVWRKRHTFFFMARLAEDLGTFFVRFKESPLKD
jgi:hypothetical protein